MLTIQTITEFCQKNNLLIPKDRLVVGVSGGADSLCLLHVLNSLKTKFDLRLTVAHLNHQLREQASLDDASFVEEIADRWHLPIVVESRNVAQVAHANKQSLEEAARQTRYNFLVSVATDVGANKIAVGHNADDQTETILMHFLRGSGLSGLQGMLPITDISPPKWETFEVPSLDGFMGAGIRLIRPLLETLRNEIEVYCQRHHLEPRQDASNQDVTFFRNKLRHVLLPQLEGYNPNIRQLLRQTGKIIAADVEILDDILAQTWSLVVKEEITGYIKFSLVDWLELSIGLKRATLRRAIFTVNQSLRDVGFEHIEKAIAIIENGQTGTEIVFPKGVRAWISYQTLIMGSDNLTDCELSTTPTLNSQQVVPVTVPGITRIPNNDWQLKANLISVDNLTEKSLKQAKEWEAYLDADVVGDKPVLRTRRPGDRFAPLGLNGHQKLKTFMINTKIPANQRDLVPLLVSNQQRLLWVCGYRLDASIAVGHTTRRVLYLKFERVIGVRSQELDN